MLERNQTYGRAQNFKALRYAVLRFYSTSIFDNEKFDTLQYSCDPSSRQMCAFDSTAQKLLHLDIFEIHKLGAPSTNLHCV